MTDYHQVLKPIKIQEACIKYSVCSGTFGLISPHIDDNTYKESTVRYKPFKEFYSYGYWNERSSTSKIKKSNLILPFNLNSYVVCSIDPGISSLGISIEHLNKGQCKELYVSETWNASSSFDNPISMENLVAQKFIETIENCPEIDLFVMEIQINPSMVVLEGMILGLILGLKKPCIRVNSKLKSYVFSPVLNNGDLKKESSKLTIDILTGEADDKGLDIINSVKGQNKVSKSKIISDLTDPRLQCRALHIYLVNSCKYICK